MAAALSAGKDPSKVEIVCGYAGRYVGKKHIRCTRWCLWLAD